MPKLEFSVLKCEDFFYGEKKDQPASTLWLANPADPVPFKFTVFGKQNVDKAHAYYSAKKIVLTVAADRNLNAVLQMV